VKAYWRDHPDFGRYWWEGGGHDIYPGVIKLKKGKYVVWPAGVNFLGNDGNLDATEIEPKYPTLKAAKFACVLTYSGGYVEKPGTEGDQS
jgi:hypothetical protein